MTQVYQFRFLFAPVSAKLKPMEKPAHGEDSETGTEAGSEIKRGGEQASGIRP